MLATILKSLKEFTQRRRREQFVKSEIRPGRIMIAWRDVDNMVYGWDMSADEELGLGLVARKIAEAKESKLKSIINAKGGK